MFAINILSRTYREGSEDKLRKTIQDRKIGVSVFIQEVLPDCAPKYWKLLTDEEGTTYVGEQSDEEKTYTDDKEAYLAAKYTQYGGKRYRLEVDRNIIISSQEAMAMGLTALASPTIGTDVKYREDYSAYFASYLNDILPEDREFFDKTPGFTLSDVEDLNPDKL